MKKYSIYIALLALGIVSCEPELSNPIDEQGYYSNGEADFSNYVALGNSITAGYADGALYLTGQKNSFPKIMAQQFALVQETENFTQPLVNDNVGGLVLGGNVIAQPRFVLAAGENGPFPARYAGTPTTDINNVLEGPFNNMGVPGIKSFHILAEGYGNVAGVPGGLANPYFVRFASSPNATVLNDAVSQNPTFFSLLLGDNDVLSFATSGGIGEDQTNNTNFAEYGPNDITDPNAFAAVYKKVVDTLMAQGAEGVLLNVPDVTSLPYFTTVPFNPLNPEENDEFAAQVPVLNSSFAGLNQAFAFLQVPERSVNFAADSRSAVLIEDENLANLSQQITEVLKQGGVPAAQAMLYGMQFGQSRQANSEDLILLTASSVIGTVNQERMQELIGFGLDAETAGMLAINGITYPLGDEYVLTPEEQEMILNATTAYNASIKAIADANGLAYVDVRAALNQLADGGIAYDGGILTSEFVLGEAFSLDGVHLTPRGYSVLANLAIEATNEQYGSEVPKVNPGNYGTVTLSNNVQ